MKKKKLKKKLKWLQEQIDQHDIYISKLLAEKHEREVRLAFGEPQSFESSLKRGKKI